MTGENRNKALKDIKHANTSDEDYLAKAFEKAFEKEIAMKPVSIKEVRANVTLTFTLPDRWSQECTMEQLFHQTKAAALHEVHKLFSLKKAETKMRNLKVLGEPVCEFTFHDGGTT